MVEWLLLQKSRLNWTLKGDRNTRFFHVMARSRQNRNEISSITVDNILFEDPNQIKRKVYEHFKKHFSEEWASRPTLGGTFKSMQSSSYYGVLETEFLEEEIKAAVKDCDGNNAPSPDGFNLFCFQKF
ncbi:hypothetical protein ACSBR1_021527 [Camellia fascicularis]